MSELRALLQRSAVRLRPGRGVVWLASRPRTVLSTAAPAQGPVPHATMRARAPGKRSRRPRARPVGPGSAGSVRMRARHTAAHEGDGNLFAVPGVAPRRADSADGGIMRARARAGRQHRAEGSEHGSAAGGGAMRTSLRRARGKATSFHAGVGGRTGNAYGAGRKPSRDGTAAKRLRRGKKRAGVVSRLLDLNMASGGGDHMLLRTASGRSAGRVSPVAIHGSVGRAQGRRGSEDESLVVDVDVRQALDQLLRVGMARVEDLTLLRKVRHCAALTSRCRWCPQH